MARVAEVLAPGTPHVIFGHTHRPGPLPPDDLAEWTMPRARGCGTAEAGCTRARSSAPGSESPYWPGTVLTLDDDGPPSIRNVLGA